MGKYYPIDISNQLVTEKWALFFLFRDLKAVGGKLARELVSQSLKRNKHIWVRT